MSKQSLYLQELNKHINTLTTSYYEKAPSLNASFPYCTLIPPSTSDLAYGDLLLFDIEVYADESVTTEEIEDLCDSLRNNLNDYILNSESNFGSHISFEGYTYQRETEQDLLARRLSFSARVFYL
jgi:hypothetical protein